MEDTVIKAALELDSKLGTISADIEKLKALLYVMNSEFFAPEKLSIREDGSDAFLDTVVMINSYPHFRNIALMCDELIDKINGSLQSSWNETYNVITNARKDK